MFVCVCVCLYRKTSLTTEPIGFFFKGQLLIGLVILGEGTTTLPKEIAPRKNNPPKKKNLN